jgi:hypothetical protein
MIATTTKKYGDVMEDAKRKKTETGEKGLVTLSQGQERELEEIPCAACISCDIT